MRQRQKGDYRSGGMSKEPHTKTFYTVCRELFVTRQSEVGHKYSVIKLKEYKEKSTCTAFAHPAGMYTRQFVYGVMDVLRLIVRPPRSVGTGHDI